MLNQNVVYPKLYPWFVLGAAMDIFVTYIVLWFGGVELNILADRVIQSHGLPGMVAYKFATVVAVLLICEYVGRRRPQTGQAVAVLAIAISFLPPAWGLTQMVARSHLLAVS